MAVPGDTDMNKFGYATAEGFGKLAKPANNVNQKDVKMEDKENPEVNCIPRPLMDDQE